MEVEGNVPAGTLRPTADNLAVGPNGRTRIAIAIEFVFSDIRRKEPFPLLRPQLGQ